MNNLTKSFELFFAEHSRKNRIESNRGSDCIHLITTDLAYIHGICTKINPHQRPHSLASPHLQFCGCVSKAKGSGEVFVGQAQTVLHIHRTARGSPPSIPAVSPQSPLRLPHHPGPKEICPGLCGQRLVRTAEILDHPARDNSTNIVNNGCVLPALTKTLIASFKNTFNVAPRRPTFKQVLHFHWTRHRVSSLSQAQRAIQLTAVQLLRCCSLDSVSRTSIVVMRSNASS